MHEGSKNSDTIHQEESPDGGNEVSSKPAVVTKPQTVSAKRENPVAKTNGERESKKEEISTLSFNLFLYIVDKFKED